MDSQANPQPVMCEVCGTYFETRRGLSSHARLHLRQLGVTLSESSGAPIDLLYQLIRERDGSLPQFKADSSSPGPAPVKKTTQQEARTPSVSEDKPKESSTSLLPLSPSGLGSVESKTRERNSSSSSDHQTACKPLWAPLETDAPITLDTQDEVHVCQLCGCWYETRKGLSSHARAHLRQIGIPENEIKGSPIDHLYQIMEEEDLKPIEIKQQKGPILDTPPKSSSKRPSSLSPPAASKRPKVSEDRICILCGEQFENRKGLACHARFHLKQIGVVDLLGKSSAIDAVQELVNTGMLQAFNPSKRSSTPSSTAGPAPALSPPPSGSRTSFPSSSPSLSPAKNTSEPPVNRAPKAKKGFRLAVDPLHRKPKSEPVEIEVSLQPQGSSDSSDSPIQKSPAAVDPSKPLSAAASTDEQTPPTVLCDYCGQLFDTRKALSCHARAHLRQLGLTWSIRTSPLDLLKEFMVHGEAGVKKGKATWTPQSSKTTTGIVLGGEPTSKSSMSPLDFSMKDKSPDKSGSSHSDTSCELCGFDFENRKALASHARAHLRQLGLIEWKADGASSPIELLNELIRKDPTKVTAITRRYRSGDLFIKKSGRAAASPSLSTDSDSVPSSSLKAAVHHQHKKGRDDSGLSRHSQGHTRTFGAHSDPNARSRGGVHSPKHGRREENQQPPRSGSIPAMLPKPPLTPLVKLVGKIYSLKCRFCEKVFHGPLSVQEQWISHLQEHILSLGYKGKESPPAAPVAAPALVHPVAI
ncbi:protein Wiz-like isoform X2 [Xyrichtys novacula]|uniref:Protein Wiz-like isoform X2 n=1 Tax=Xyrichtys novacula TaxID=13765 RepID=A0AAV1EZC9_XYRNO|nr:protein Wiz-like isoform X2 [Xyrichtys novacula]